MALSGSLWNTMECAYANCLFDLAVRCAIDRPMILSAARDYFWFYGYPLLQAEPGARS
jgi:hypothetical protein